MAFLEDRALCSPLAPFHSSLCFSQKERAAGVPKQEGPHRHLLHSVLCNLYRICVVVLDENSLHKFDGRRATGLHRCLLPTQRQQASFLQLRIHLHVQVLFNGVFEERLFLPDDVLKVLGTPVPREMGALDSRSIWSKWTCDQCRTQVVAQGGACHWQK